MRYIALYLLMVAIVIGVIATATGALAHPVACQLGSYGQIEAQSAGQC